MEEETEKKKNEKPEYSDCPDMKGKEIAPGSGTLFHPRQGNIVSFHISHRETVRSNMVIQ